MPWRIFFSVIHKSVKSSLSDILFLKSTIDFSILYLNQTLYYILVVFPVVLDVQLHGLYIRYLCIHFKIINVSHSKCVTSVMKKEIMKLQ